VAGTFYPAEPEALKTQLDGFLREAAESFTGRPAVAPKALIVPHAGYIYSGPIAASAYVRLLPWRGLIKRVILLGPCHRIPLEGLATSSADFFSTPLGNVPLDRKLVGRLLSLPQVVELDEAHQREHSLEVQLPFLQTVLDGFSLVPLVFGQTCAKAIGEVWEHVWGDDTTLIVVSSDLSHYHNYLEACEMDRRAAQAIERCAPGDLRHDQACGQLAIQALLLAAKRHDLSPLLLDLRNSGDTAGSKDRVVGYGSFEFRPAGNSG
jgi:AmmeMemoRadiSam system protein B